MSLSNLFENDLCQLFIEMNTVLGFNRDDVLQHRLMNSRKVLS